MPWTLLGWVTLLRVFYKVEPHDCIGKFFVSLILACRDLRDMSHLLLSDESSPKYADKRLNWKLQISQKFRIVCKITPK